MHVDRRSSFPFRALPLRWLLVALAFLISTLPGANVSAELIEIDLVEGSGDAALTRDTESGLDWLDLDQTDGLNIPMIEAGAGGWATLGFRVATITEVLDLHGQFGLESTFGEPLPVLIEMAPRALAFRALLGCSEFACVDPDSLDDTTFSAGLARGDGNRPTTPDLVWFADIIILLGSDPSLAQVRYAQVPEDSIGSATSVYLVRDVPELSPLAMMMLFAGAWLFSTPGGGGEDGGPSALDSS